MSDLGALAQEKAKRAGAVQSSAMARQEQKDTLGIQCPVLACESRPSPWLILNFGPIMYRRDGRCAVRGLALTDLGSCKQRASSLRDGDGVVSCMPPLFPAAPSG